MSNVATALADLHSDLRELWAHQAVAVDEIMAHLDAGRNVVVDAPTGSGKSVIAAHIAARYGGKSIYMADEVQLVRQMANSHSSMYRTLVGHQNYCNSPWACDDGEFECEVCPLGFDGNPRITSWYGLHLVREHGWDWEPAARAGEQAGDCAYRVAKLLAAGHPYVTLSSQYFLTDKLYIGIFAKRDLLILDECDAIQQTADRTFGEDFSYRVMQRYGFTDELRWSPEQAILLQRAGQLLADFGEQLRAVRSATNNEEELYRIDQLLERVSKAQGLVVTNDIVLSPSDQGFSLRYVDPAPLLARHAWDNGRVPVVALSATPGRAEVFARIAGLDPANTVTVHVPSTFDVRHRTVRVLDGPNMSKMGARDPDKLDAMAARILEVAQGRTLVLTNSRAQAQALGQRLQGRAIGHGSTQASKDAALEDLAARPDGILVSQSMWRGVDLVGDLCRTVVLAKVPWADFSDPLVRVRKDRLEDWYASETATKLVQGCGRAVRNESDWCRIYILDGGYRGSHGRLRRHMPAWFLPAMVL